MLDNYVLHSSPTYLIKLNACIYNQNSTDSDQLASQKQADLDLHHFSKQVIIQLSKGIG